ncbi:MAG: arginine--tRNA ligase [Bacillota bacterium]|nr:arginine--tRNA ligase [Bacillota bacterium]
MPDFKARTIDWLAAAAGLERTQIATLLEQPPDPKLGDLALPCFRLAAQFRRAPQKIAAEIAASELERPDFIAAVEATGAYVNVRFHPGAFVAAVVTAIQQAGAKAADTAAADSTDDDSDPILIEFSSPNIAKPFHVGHGFSTILGESLARIHSYRGARVLRFNHLGDYGTQFGRLIVAWERWRDDQALEEDPIAELTRIYVRFHAEVDKDPTLDDEARQRFRALENGEPEAVALWERFRELSLESFSHIYRRLGIRFDNWNGESFYSPFIPGVIEQLRDAGLLEHSDGAEVVRLDDLDLPPALLLKSDGTTIYASRDVAAAIWRWQQHHFARNLYVVGIPQTLHFRQVFAVLKKMGYDWADRCQHVGFGTIRFQTGDVNSEEGAQISDFSTRAGNIVKLEDLLNETVAKTRSIMEQNQAGRDDGMTEEEILLASELVGRAAVQFLYLKNGRERDILFSWEEMLDFEGDTAPYLLYTNTRIASIMRRAGGEEAARASHQDLLLLGSESERELATHLAGFDSIVELAARQSEPSNLARWLLQLARSYNRYYAATPILLTEDAGLRRARLALCQAVASRLGLGLHLLGIETVERM